MNGHVKRAIDEAVTMKEDECVPFWVICCNIVGLNLTSSCGRLSGFGVLLACLPLSLLPFLD